MSLDRGPSKDIERKVFDAEIVDDEEAPAPPKDMVRRVIVTPVARVIRDDRTRRVSITAVQHGVFVAQGVGSWAKRAWDAGTMGVYRRQIKTAEAMGDRAALAEWLDRRELALERRHKRLMDLPKLAAGIAKVVGFSVAAVVLLILVAGVVAQLTGGRFAGVVMGVLDVLRWVFSAVAFAWTPLLVAAPFLLALAAWKEGKRAGVVPGWLQASGMPEGAIVVDERAIANALQHLGVKGLTSFFKEGGQLVYTKIPARDKGDLGVVAQIRLPIGAHAGDVIRNKTRLAANLGRAGIETWPSTGEDEGLLDLYVADRGALDTGAGPWPFLDLEEPIDVYLGVPVGITLRGDQVVPPLDGTSWLIGGRPGQGKTTFARLLVMGACLDPRAEIWGFVLADNPDFDPLAERFSRYQVGVGTEVVAAALEAFYDLWAEIERRGRVMREKGAPTAAEAGFPPLVAFFDEIHRLFQHRDLGKDAAAAAEDVIKQARKYGVIVILITQSPTATSIPKPVTRETICRVAFSVVDQIANDALLGDGHYKRGVRATELRPGSKHAPGDRGKALSVGVVPDSDWSMLLGHHVDQAGVRHVAELAMRFLHEQGRRVAQRGRETERDLLEDLAAVLPRDERVDLADVPALLARHAPRWLPYRKLTGKALREVLEKSYGIRVPNPGNKPKLDPVAVREALARRAAG